MFYDPADIHAAALRGKATAAWHRWGHKRPRRWLAMFGGLPCPMDSVLNDCKAEAQGLIRPVIIERGMTTDSRFDAA